MVQLFLAHLTRRAHSVMAIPQRAQQRVVGPLKLLHHQLFHLVNSSHVGEHFKHAVYGFTNLRSINEKKVIEEI
jgi:hypothetical protein